MDRAEYVAALLREREHYVVRGMASRVAGVDAELARFDAAPVAAEAETTSAARPRKGR